MLNPTLQKGTYEGACDGLEVQVVRLKRELNEDRLKYAVRNYKHMQVDIKVRTCLACVWVYLRT